MPTSNDMQKMLDIQDENILFKDNCVTYGTHKGKKCKEIHCKLTYTPQKCRKCGIKNHDFRIFKNGTQTSRVTFPISGIHLTYLLIKKQRFYCTACECSFTARTPIVEKNCFISNYVKANILSQSSTAKSKKDISKETNVSQVTVQRVIDKGSIPYRPYYLNLPANLSFDEFKYASGKMAFEYINAETGDILDILPARDGRRLRNHFTTRYSLKQRNRVQTITIDMNSSYIGVIKDLFPKAKIIIDRFHIIQLINRAMNKTRVKVMNQLNTSNSEDQKKYRRLKKYWKKLLKSATDLAYTTYDYYPMFGQRLESAIVSEMLEYNQELKDTYDVYQGIIKAMNNNDFKHLNALLYRRYDNDLSNYMRTSLKTLRKHLPYIGNTIKYPYNNGRLEGMNNKIKVLNRVSYGYRNFYNFKTRIILHFNMKEKSNKNRSPSQLSLTA